MKTMKRFFRSFLALAVVGSLFLSSCTDLDRDPFDSITTIDTESEVSAVLLAAYTGMYGLMGHNGYFSAQENSTDEVIIPTRGSDWGDGGVWVRCHDHEWTADEGYFNNAWNSLYSIVNQVNNGLSAYASNPGLTPELAAELRGLRSVAYYMLLDLFGNVRLVTEGGDQGQVSSTAMYNYLEGEISAIKPLLTSAPNGKFGRVDYWTITALETKLKLNKGIYTTGNAANGDFAGAIVAADDILNNGPFGLSNSYEAIFAPQNSNNIEHIFVIPYDAVFAGGFNLPQMTLHYGSQQTFNTQEQPWNGYATTADFYNSYIDPAQNPGPQGQVIGTAPNAALVTGTKDGRLSNFIAGPQLTSGGSPVIDNHPDTANEPDGQPLVFSPYINEQAPGAWRQAGARLGKYSFENGTTRNLNNDFPIFRYTDIWMMKAEALWRINNADANALTMVNTVRGRAGVDPFGSLTNANFLAERGREFFIESWRRNDMIRFGEWGSTWIFKDTPSPATHTLFPIPRTQVDGAGLTQNPGYN